MIRRCTHTPSGPAADSAAAVAALVPVLTTDRLVLRAPAIGDLDAWTTLMVPDSDGFLGGPHTEEDAWEAFCVYTAGWILHGHGLWSVERMSDKTLLGFVLLGLEWGDPEPELGWMLLPEHRGQGYATEAAKAARDFAQELLGDGAFRSNVVVSNAASNVLAERLGAVRDRAAEAQTTVKLHVWRHGARA